MNMKSIFNSGLTRFCITATIIFNISLITSAQRFETNKVYLSDDGSLTQTIKIEAMANFSIKKDYRHAWAKCEEQNAAVKISVTDNTSSNSRSCFFILLDETNTPVDTLEVIQSGKVSTTISEVANTSTSSSKNVSSTNESSSSSLRSMGGQCAAITKKGTRCSRNASAGSIYCWQHNRSVSEVTNTSISSPKNNKTYSGTSSGISRNTGGQCAATTKKGTRCSRKASASSIYCWQHNK